MASYLDTVPFSGIIRIRDMMYTVDRPFRLDQGDVSFDAPDSVKEAMTRAVAENRSHYLQTTGVPRLLELIADKMRRKNGIPVRGLEELMVTTGGIHGVFIICQGLLEPGDEVLMPDPEWPPAPGNVACAHAVPVSYPLYESEGWRPDVEEMARLVTPRTRAIYVNSPNNPTGGVLTRADLEAIAHLARERGLWVISDEAYEDVLYDGREHVSIASLPGMYERTIPLYTFSKSYAMTGLRLGYLAVHDRTMRERIKKMLFYTVSNVASVVQFGGIGALEGPQDVVGAYRTELAERRASLLRGAARRVGRHPDRRAAGRRVLRLRADRSRVALAAPRRVRVIVVGHDGVPDQARADRLRPRRRLRRARRRLRTLLLRARTGRVAGRAGGDEGAVESLTALGPRAQK